MNNEEIRKSKGITTDAYYIKAKDNVHHFELDILLNEAREDEWGKTRKAVYKDTVKKIFADLEEDMVYKPDFMQGAILYKGTKVSYQALKKKYGVEDAKSTER